MLRSAFPFVDFVCEAGEDGWRQGAAGTVDERQESLVAGLLILCVHPGEVHLSVQGLHFLHLVGVVLSIVVLSTKFASNNNNNT